MYREEHGTYPETPSRVALIISLTPVTSVASPASLADIFISLFTHFKINK